MAWAFVRFEHPVTGILPPRRHPGLLEVLPVFGRQHHSLGRSFFALGCGRFFCRRFCNTKTSGRHASEAAAASSPTPRPRRAPQGRLLTFGIFSGLLQLSLLRLGQHFSLENKATAGWRDATTAGLRDQAGLT